jgi:hypothetical protein
MWSVRRGFGSAPLAMPGSVEGVNNKALLIVNRSYGLKSGDRL